MLSFGTANSPISVAGGTVPEKHNPDSAEQNFQVHEKRHVFNVIEVVLKLR